MVGRATFCAGSQSIGIVALWMPLEAIKNKLRDYFGKTFFQLFFNQT